MSEETEIKTKDLLFYPSAQLNQNDDGGGQLVKTPLTDATSEVFDPTSSVQKVNGGFTARLVYPAVLTEGREKLLGSFCAVSMKCYGLVHAAHEDFAKWFSTKKVRQMVNLSTI